MRLILGLAALLWLARPGIVNGQSFELHGSAGPTLVDRGYSLAAGAGFSPTSRLAVAVDVERTRLFSRERSDGSSTSRFRGGTLTMAAVQLRVTPLGHGRVGPYGFAGFAAGVSRPTVSDAFPERVTNDARALFFGGGIQVPLRERLDLFADARMILGAEAGELLVMAPVRAGVAWRF